MSKTNSKQPEKVCFVIMGFGKKTDYESGRTLDLDETYSEIIKPAVEAAKLRCVRANEISQSGIIDVQMYEMLLRADLVVADISTANPNALYELGVRHAMRPYSTIVIKEEMGRFHFDLNHIATLEYRHLGEEIGAKEARRASAELTKLILGVINDPRPDSPVYTFLPKLAQPKLSTQEFVELVERVEEAGERLSDIIANAKAATEKSDHVTAYKLFSKAAELTNDNIYLVQQYALHRYKSGQPSKLLALTDAAAIIESLKPENSNDPETLGIAGAIYQRLAEIADDPSALDRAIQYYVRGFNLRHDYYNGENAAILLEQRSLKQTDSNEQRFDQMSAKKIRKDLVATLDEIKSSENFDERSDKIWVYATLANSNLAIGNSQEYSANTGKFEALGPAAWQKETFERGISMVTEYLKAKKEIG